jgi:hypothetical protein
LIGLVVISSIFLMDFLAVTMVTAWLAGVVVLIIGGSRMKLA